MSQLVGQQTITAIGVRRVLSGAENDVVAHRVRQCVDRVGRLRRTRVRVHAHVAEVVSETRLEPRARRWVERQSGRVQHVVDDRGQPVGCVTGFGQVCLRFRRRTLELRAVFATLVTLAAARAVTPARTLALQVKRVLRRRLWRRRLHSLYWCGNFTHYYFIPSLENSSLPRPTDRHHSPSPASLLRSYGPWPETRARVARSLQQRSVCRPCRRPIRIFL